MMLTQPTFWALEPLSSWAGTHAITSSWGPQAWTLGSTGDTVLRRPQHFVAICMLYAALIACCKLLHGCAGASSVIVFYVLFKLSPYLSNASNRTYSTLSAKDKIDWDSRYRSICRICYERCVPSLTNFCQPSCRVSSTLHAMAISALAAYLILWSDTFADKSSISEVIAGASIL